MDVQSKGVRGMGKPTGKPVFPYFTVRADGTGMLK